MGAIFLRQAGGLVPMREQPYEAEALLQTLVAEHPEILTEDDSNDARVWLLVKREAGIADRAERPDRWSLDHLFLDELGVPTLVEVKRSSDTRARREVVAQMLDYAANATAHWNVETIRSWFEAECDRRDVDPSERLNETFGVGEPDDYWETVKTNLAAERIRLVFVADEIPPELRSILEFLNRQMSETEVFAIEVKQYVDAAGQQQTIVPRTIGRTEAAKAAKRGGGGPRPTRTWDERSLIDELARVAGEDSAAIAQSLIEWASSRDGVVVDYGSGAQVGVAQVRLEPDEVQLLTPFIIRTKGVIEIPFIRMIRRAQRPFDARAARDELRRRINAAVPDAAIPPEEERSRPRFALVALADRRVRESFCEAIDWALDEARRSDAS